MKKEVRATICTKLQTGEEEDQIEMITDATFYRKQGKYYLSYDESMLTGLEGTHATLKMEQDGATLIRTGSCPAHLQFKKHETRMGMYETGEGAVPLSTYATDLHNTLTDEGGAFRLHYTLEWENCQLGTYQLDVTVAPKG